MTNITFKKIRIQNFLSFGKTPVEFTYGSGLNYVTGFNKDADSFNGVGKTSLLVESISFALFGETYRDINNADVVNDATNAPCIVELWLSVNEDEYRIMRSIKPNKLFLYKNADEFGDEVPDSHNLTKTIPETNKDIIVIIGVSKIIFNNTLVMTNNQKNAFIGQKTDLKTKFIEGLISLEVFSKMLEVAKKQYSEKSKEVDKAEIHVDELRKNISNFKNYEAAEQVKIEEKIKKLETSIIEMESLLPVDRLDEIGVNETKIKELEATISEQEEKIQRANIKKAGIDSNIKHLQTEYNKFNQIQLNCPTCKRPMGDHDPEVIQKEKEQAAKILQDEKDKQIKLVAAIKKTDAQVDINRREKKNLHILNTQFKDDWHQALSSKNQIFHLQEDLNNLHTYVNPFTDKIVESGTQLIILEKEFAKLQKELKLQEAIKFVASANGVKSTIVKKIIKTLNDRLAYYLKKLKSPYRCTFDEFFEEKVFNAKGKEVSYNNASGGEAKRIDFALMFAFRDIRRMQSNIHVNLSVFDELFDSSICSNAIVQITDLLKDMADEGNECFYVITHRADQIDMSGCKVIKLEKSQGITRIL